MAEYYLIVKTIHIVSVILWMAGLIMLPRLYFYHIGAKNNEAEKFAELEKRLLAFTINPAMIFVFITGLALIMITKVGAPGTGAWIHVKLLMILVLAGFHGLLSAERKKILEGKSTRKPEFFKFISDLTTGFVFVIVFLAVTKPF